jgi:predicted metal-dependent peptidase
MASSREKGKANPATLAFVAAKERVVSHPLFASLSYGAPIYRHVMTPPNVPDDAWLIAEQRGTIYAHPKRAGSVDQWTFLLAQSLLYFGMQCFQRDRADWRAWQAACDVVIVQFLRAMKLAPTPEHVQLPDGLPSWDESRWYTTFATDGIPDWAHALNPGGKTMSAMRLTAAGERPPRYGPQRTTDWAKLFATGISESVGQAVEVAAGARDKVGAGSISLRGPAQRARSWFMSSFPLLGAMVAAFTFIENAAVCQRESIAVAAIDERSRELFLNPAAGLSEQELRFVIAHEVLHVALRHMDRRAGREAYLWNVACDFVINQWLIDMQVGVPPAIGMLHDAALAGMSAESVYDRLVTDLRRARKLLTFAGAQCDMMDREQRTDPADFTDLDAFYRGQLMKGFALHESQGRGLLPAGLVEEIRALAQPPVAWDVELARWFDQHFPPIEKMRTYARMSRRQSATPDVPRPRWVADPRLADGRTFGVVLDTSGSMDRQLLGKALGAIASYSVAKEVFAARVVFCDASAYDQGYMPPEDIAQRVSVRGRGGTVLQPGIDLLQTAKDFPPHGPILIITDGDCDRLTVNREHAYLLPRGKRLPFATRAEVFLFS